MSTKRNVPGRDVPAAGEYREYTKTGKPTKRTYTLDKTDKFPPTQKKDRSFRKNN